MRITAIACIVVGLLLLGWGLQASDSIGSSFSRFFSGSPSDKAIWLLSGGACLLVLGLAGVFRSGKD